MVMQVGGGRPRSSDGKSECGRVACHPAAITTIRRIALTVLCGWPPTCDRGMGAELSHPPRELLREARPPVCGMGVWGDCPPSDSVGDRLIWWWGARQWDGSVGASPGSRLCLET
jgi:hypothetical protein